MILCDVNILVSAFREDTPRHAAYRDWLEEQLNADRAFGVSPLVLSGFLRVVTNRRAMKIPTPLETALRFCDQLMAAPQAVMVQSGQRHWGIFIRLCHETNATANHVPDAYLAALAIEHACEWMTADRGFARYPGLRWRDPGPSPGDPRRRCRGRRGVTRRSWLCRWPGREHLPNALDAYRAVGAMLGEANCLTALTDLDTDRLDPAARTADYQRALDLYREAGDLRGENTCLRRLGRRDPALPGGPGGPGGLTSLDRRAALRARRTGARIAATAEPAQRAAMRW